MIVFNNIRILQDDKYITIDAEIENNKYYKNMYIDSVIIDTQDTFSPNGPSNNPIYTYKAQPLNSDIYTENDLANKVTDEDNIPVQDENNTYYSRKVHLELTKVDLNLATLEKNMFFIYIVAGGVPAPDTPCGYDNNIAVKVLVNTYPIYRNIMNYIKELGNTCNVPYNLIDKSLQLKMLDISIQTGNNIEAINIWKKYFMDNITNEPINCNCNG